MHIEFLLDDGTGRTVLRAQADPEDRPLPVDSLIFDAAPAVFDSDRIAAAGAMLFSGYATQELSFGKKVSPELADATREATGCVVTSKASGRKLETLDERDTARASLQTTSLHVGLTMGLDEQTPPVDVTRLGLVPGERFQGALHGVKESMIASNSWLVASYLDPTTVLIAVGLLYSHDFLAQDVVADLPDGSVGHPSPVVETLCAAVGIGVS